MMRYVKFTLYGVFFSNMAKTGMRGRGHRPPASPVVFCRSITAYVSSPASGQHPGRGSVRQCPPQVDDGAFPLLEKRCHAYNKSFSLFKEKGHFNLHLGYIKKGCFPALKSISPSVNKENGGPPSALISCYPFFFLLQITSAFSIFLSPGFVT